MPDFIAVTDHGVVCTSGTKLAEHGGFSDDDRNVALLVSAPDIKPGVVVALTNTTQSAPTILRALGLDRGRLDGVREEGTEVLSHWPRQTLVHIGQGRWNDCNPVRAPRSSLHSTSADDASTTGDTRRANLREARSIARSCVEGANGV